MKKSRITKPESESRECCLCSCKVAEGTYIHVKAEENAAVAVVATVAVVVGEEVGKSKKQFSSLMQSISH